MNIGKANKIREKGLIQISIKKKQSLQIFLVWGGCSAKQSLDTTFSFSRQTVQRNETKICMECLR